VDQLNITPALLLLLLLLLLVVLVLPAAARCPLLLPLLLPAADPRSWVARRNSMRPGVYIADFQTADKVAVEVLPAPADGDIQVAAVAAAVIPPGRQEDATLNLPAQRLIKAAPATVDGQVGVGGWVGG
jgi:hypothetical protein